MPNPAADGNRQVGGRARSAPLLLHAVEALADLRVPDRAGEGGEARAGTEQVPSAAGMGLAAGADMVLPTPDPAIPMVH